MDIKKTIRKKIVPISRRRRGLSEKASKELSSTMQIPVEAVFDKISARSASNLDVSVPDRESFRISLGKEQIVIGRDNECDLPLPFSNVSRLHARIFNEREEYLIEDLDSTNGTFVNNVRISRCVLRSNDRIQIGATNMLFTQQKVRQ